MNHPVSTYRLQINKDFDFSNAGDVAFYLKKLGISHAYLSPVFESGPDSLHGYDVMDFTKISSERGGAEAFRAMVEAFEHSGINIILDIVPNHMSNHCGNPFWRDVLTKGRQSVYWSLFDMRVAEEQKIKMPVLSASLDEALSAKEIRVEPNGDDLELQYYDHSFPLNDESKKLFRSDASTPVETILAMQAYELTSWTDASEMVSYRRFFDVMELIGVRVEDQENYNLAHQGLVKLLNDYPAITGVRVDHIDGLADPKSYLDRLAKDVGQVWIEKILARGETLCSDWKTDGTTGYEFIDFINRLFIEPEGFNRIRDFWIETVRPKWKDFSSCVRDSKTQALHDLFQPELKRIIALTAQEGFDREKALAFWTGMTVALGIYRTYTISSTSDSMAQEWIERADKAASAASDAYARVSKEFLPMLLHPSNDRQRQIVREWQQLTGPAMAKGLEDTAHYRFTPLLACNEVGCPAEIADTGKEAFFDWLKARSDASPLAMKSTSTHDTKRSEDLRHNLYALSDRPDEWIGFVRQCLELSDGFIKLNPPSLSARYFIFQTLAGSWPLNPHSDLASFKTRVQEYLVKASREARAETSWLEPAEDYEAGVGEFIERIFDDEDLSALIQNFACRVAGIGAVNSLSVQTLKILSPGIPDIYQGTCFWDFSFVDPDNRRPVDYNMRSRLLDDARNIETVKGRTALLDKLVSNWKDGEIKLWLTQKLIEIRNEYFSHIDDQKISMFETSGPHADHLIAYRFGPDNGNHGAIILLPRYCGHLTATTDMIFDWQNTQFSFPFGDFQYKNLLTGKDLPALSGLASDHMKEFPLAILRFEAKGN